MLEAQTILQQAKDQLAEIVKQTERKNSMSDNYLKTIIINYLETKQREDVSKEAVNKLIADLEF